MFLSLMAAAALVEESAPGKLFAMGGGSTTPEVTRAFIQHVGPRSKILVLGQAREDVVNARSSVEWLVENGARNVTLIDPPEYNAAARDELRRWLRQARGVWIPGGDQELFIGRWEAAFLRETLGTWVARGGSVFGTSAGAMVMSDPMIYGPGATRDEVQIGRGIGLTSYLIDTHFRERNREKRLRNGSNQTGNRRLLGLDAGEWVIIQADKIVFRQGNPLVEEPN
jgi:cyanophycinase